MGFTDLNLASDYILFNKDPEYAMSERQKRDFTAWCKLIEISRQNPCTFIEEVLGVEMLDYQRYIVMNSWNTPYCVWCCSRSSGKALALDTKIPLPEGRYTTMGELKEGDYVIGDNGESTKILYTSEVFNGHDCYEITFDDGEKIVADANHIWSVVADGKNKELTTEQLIKSNREYYIGLNKPVQYSNVDQSIDQRKKFISDLFGNNNSIFVSKDKVKKVTQILSSLGIFNKIIEDNGKIKVIKDDRNKKRIEKIKQVESVPTKCIYVDNESHLFLCGEKFTVTHNTTLGAIYIMAKTLLVPNFKTYIISSVGSQSIEMFQKIESIATKSIASFKSLTDVFISELVKNQANTNGFSHNPASHKCTAHNGSQIMTLNSVVDNVRSKRSNLNFYDEASFIDDELFHVTMPFCVQNSKFQIGVDMDANDILMQPKPFPNQMIFASSAGRTDQYFYKMYKQASMNMDAGNPDWFCVDLNSNAVINATRRGEKLPEPLLTQETIDSAMREDKEKALREYGNIFTNEGGDGQIIRRADIIRNSYPRLPLTHNPDNRTLFSIAYDPARLKDNSVVAIGQFYEDPNVGWKMRIVNVTTFADIFKKNKTPMSTPNQIEALKKIITNFNGKQVADYENIRSILVDAGSGGAGVPITDFLCEDFVVDGITHRGLIDVDYNENDGKKFPNAVKDVLHLISPAKYKSDLFEALIKMMDQNLIEFTEEYNDKGYITLIFEKNTKTGELKQRFTYPSEEEEKKLSKQGITVITEMRKLSHDEELALKQIDLAKNELVNIYRYKQSNGRDRFDLCQEKKNKLNDDKAYVIALLAYDLAQLRREHIVKKQKPKQDYTNLFTIKQPKNIKIFS